MQSFWLRLGHHVGAQRHACVRRRMEGVRICHFFSAKRSTWARLRQYFTFSKELRETLINDRWYSGKYTVHDRMDEMLYFLFEFVGSLLMPWNDRLEGSFGFEIFLRVIGYKKPAWKKKKKA